MIGDSCLDGSANLQRNAADYFLLDRLDEGLSEKTAIQFGDRLYSYTNVAQRTYALSDCLLEDSRFFPGCRVYIVLADVPAFAWSLFGVWLSGGIVCMGNPQSPVDQLKSCIDYIEPQLIITTPRVAKSLRDFEGAFALYDVWLVPETATGGDCEAPIKEAMADRSSALTTKISEGDSQKQRRQPVHATDPCMWLFTSGSTGEPKAAMHCHQDFVFSCEMYAKRTIGYRASDRCVSVPNLYFGYATGTNLLFPFSVGATCCLFSERPTALTVAEAMQQYRPTIVTQVPTMMSKLLAADREDSLLIKDVRVTLSAGEALPEPLLNRYVQRFGGEVYDGIGSAEMFHIYISNRPGDVTPGSLGQLVPGYEAIITPVEALGPGAEAVSVGEVGVLWIKGGSTASGYFRDRQKSVRTFFGEWCRTGDLFSVDVGGHYYFEGRADELLKVSGQWVAPQKVESCLLCHNQVEMVAVVGVSVDGLVVPKAYIVQQNGQQNLRQDKTEKQDLKTELKEFVKQNLSKHMYPRQIEFVRDLPKNDRGKIDRKRLRLGWPV